MNAIWGALAAAAALAALAAPPVSAPPVRTSDAIGPGWSHRLPITLNNSGEAQRFLPVRIALDAANFDFDRARPNGEDLRFTEGDGWTLMSHWIERYDAAARQAVVWVKVPGLRANGAEQIYLYYGNPGVAGGSNGTRAFDFFDDFGQPGTGYYALGPAAQALGKDQSWERSPPHTLSVVELSRDGFRYWGYYGLVECGGIGLARSNDLQTWVKPPANPLLSKGGERWPSVVRRDDALYMAADRDYCTTSYIALRKSSDGLNWGGDADYLTLVKPEPGIKNQNANLFYDPQSGKYYLYWYRGGPSLQLWQIRARSADTPEGLADPSSERIVIEELYEIAAPSMLYRDGAYLLSTEINDRGWMTRIYSGSSPLGPFAPLAGNPVLGDNQACFFQHVFDGALFGSLCKDTGPGGWIVTQRRADLSAGLSRERALDESLWRADGRWSLSASATPSQGVVAQAGGPRSTLIGSWSEGDAAGEARVALADGAGIGVRASEDGRAMYAATLDGGVLRLARRDAGAETVLAERSDTITGGADHELSLRAVGAALDVAVDGEVVLRAIDPRPLPAGRLALLGADGVRFDDARLRKLAPAAPTVTAGHPQEAAGEGGAWLGLRRSATEPVRRNPPAPEALQNTLITIVVILAAAGVVVLAHRARRGRRRA